MKTTRRKFLFNTAMASGALISGASCTMGKKNPNNKADYSRLDEVLNLPVFKRDLFPDPIIIDKVEVLIKDASCIYRVRSKDGAEGISIGHSFVAKGSYPMVPYVLAQYFEGKDARDLDQLIFNAVELNVRNQGTPMDVQVAGIEFAILDMMGIIANKPAGQLIGELQRTRVPIYLGTHFSNLRKLEPEQSLALMQEDVDITSAKAIKLRAGLGNQLGANGDNAPGRTEKLIRMAREKFGDDMVLMIDGNGSYSVDEAIRIGRILEDYNYDFFEEPLPWTWYEEQKELEPTLDIKLAGGEEEFSLHAFRYLIGNGIFQIVQPDIFYFGGMIRTMKVARMAEAAGLQITPHISPGGLGFLYMLQMVSVCPAAYKYHEFKMFEMVDPNGVTIPVESKSGPFISNNGVIEVPMGSGIGVTIDPDYIKTHKPFLG